jgi:hypothetical protein
MPICDIDIDLSLDVNQPKEINLTLDPSHIISIDNRLSSVQLSAVKTLLETKLVMSHRQPEMYLQAKANHERTWMTYAVSIRPMYMPSRLV